MQPQSSVRKKSREKEGIWIKEKLTISTEYYRFVGRVLQRVLLCKILFECLCSISSASASPTICTRDTWVGRSLLLAHRKAWSSGRTCNDLCRCLPEANKCLCGSWNLNSWRRICLSLGDRPTQQLKKNKQKTRQQTLKWSFGIAWKDHDATSSLLFSLIFNKGFISAYLTRMKTSE